MKLNVLMFYHTTNRNSGLIVTVLASRTLDRWFQPRSGRSKDHRTCNCCIFVKHPQLKSTSKDWLTHNQNIVSEWSEMSTGGLLL